jgi:hypothetical protein
VVEKLILNPISLKGVNLHLRTGSSQDKPINLDVSRSVKKKETEASYLHCRINGNGAGPDKQGINRKETYIKR